MINRIKINGFKRLHNIDLEMRPLMVMIGANGIGKTSVFELLSLIAASAEGKLNYKLSELGGIADVLTKEKAEELSITIDMSVPGHNPLEYELQISRKGHSYIVSSETLTQDRGYKHPFKHIESNYDDIKYFDTEEGKLLKPNWTHNPFETSLSQVPRMFSQPEELRQTLNSATIYHTLNVKPNAPVKLPQQMKPAELPGKDGEDLFSFLYNLSQSDKDRYGRIMGFVRAAFPGFEELSFPPVAAGMIAMKWKEKYFNTPFYMNQLSEGMLRFLWLASLLQSPVLPAITMIDEPEVSLHPELLNLLASLLREASSRTQIIVATHSDQLIRFLDPKEVVTMNLTDDGLAEALWADTLDLDDWLSEYTLDEVWGMGRMGGRA